MKIRVILLCVALVGPCFSAMPVVAQDTTGKMAMGKEAKWQGHVIRIDSDHSMIDINGGPAPSKTARKVAFDSSTEWTNMGKPAQMADVKEGAFVILVGHVDDKGILHATRVDLRLPR